MKFLLWVTFLFCANLQLSQSQTNCTHNSDCDNISEACGGYCEDSKCMGGWKCPMETPFCYESNCVECVFDKDCSAVSRSACDMYEKKCIQCNSNFDCTFDPDRAICNTDRHECIQCKNREDCERDSKCGSTCSGERCTSGIDCESKGLHCKSDYNDEFPAECANCGHSGHCPQGFVCYEKECEECLNTVNCNSRDNCGNKCVNLTCVSVGPSNCSIIPNNRCDVFTGECIKDFTSMSPTEAPNITQAPHNNSASRIGNIMWQMQMYIPLFTIYACNF